MFIRTSRLQLGNFAINDAKRLLQQYRPTASVAVMQRYVRSWGNSGSGWVALETSRLTHKRHPPTARPRRTLNDQRPITLVRLLCLCHAFRRDAARKSCCPMDHAGRQDRACPRRLRASRAGPRCSCHRWRRRRRTEADFDFRPRQLSPEVFIDRGVQNWEPPPVPSRL